jgi:hypothetical protein
MSQRTALDERTTPLVRGLLTNILGKKEAVPFAEPVDHIGFGLLDYTDVIKKMMDLGTVTKNLEKGVYKDVETCLDDVQLVWDNCKLYNVEDSKIYKLAVKLEAYTQKLAVDNFGTQITYGKNNPSYNILKSQLAEIEAMDE